VKITKQARRDAKELFRACRVNGLLDDAKALQVVRQVIAAKPRGYFGILNYFQRLVRLDLDRHTARVESPVPLAEPQQAAIRTNLTPPLRRGPDLCLYPKSRADWRLAGAGRQRCL